METVIDHALKQQQLDRSRVQEMGKIVNQIRNMTLSNHRAMALFEQYDIIVERVTYLQHLQQEVINQEIQLQRLVEALEGGRLTEQLLPPSVLKDVLGADAQTAMGGVALGSTWYYQYCDISFLMAEKEQYVYRVQLPLATGHDIFYYELTAFPVPYLPGKRRRAIVKPRVGYNTQTGQLFEPAVCMGHDPIVCVPTVLYSDSRYRCEQGLITGFTPDKTQCDIQELQNNYSEQYEVQGQTVLVTEGEDVSLSCPGMSPQRVHLDRGTYTTIVPSSCKLTGKGWSKTAPWKAEANATQKDSTMEQWDNDDEWLDQDLPYLPGVVLIPTHVA